MRSSYSLQLVLLSYAVAVLASHVTLNLAQRLRPVGGLSDTRRPLYWPWIVGGAFSMGTGIWSMHFIGMLAFHLPIQVAYDLPLTAASYVIAVVISGFALNRFHRNDTTLRGIALPSVFIGIGISAMHYTGMAAMRMSPGIDYDPLLVATSVLIAIGASMAALWIAFTLPHGQRGAGWYQLAAASVMGAAIAGMHYTGMVAANFAPNAVCIASGPRLDATPLAITISAFTFVILGSTLLLSIVDARLQSTIARSAEALRVANDELEQRVLERTAQLRAVNHTLQSEIAARQQTQLAITRFAAIVESSDDAIVGMSLEGIVTNWNRGAEKLFGYSASQIIGQPILKLIPAERTAEVVEMLARIARGEGTDHFETVWVAQSGNCLDVSVSISPIRDEENRIVGASTIARDITERRQALQKLRKQLERQDLLHRITRAIGERQDLPSIFEVIVRSLEDNLPLDFCCACLYETTTRALTVVSLGARTRSLAVELGLAEKATIDLDQTGLARCVWGQLMYEPDIRAVKLPWLQRLGEAGLRSFVAAPLVVEGQFFGALLAARRAPHGLASADCEFLKQLSEHVALAAHQTQLHSTLQQAYNDLRQSQQTAMQQERLRALGQMASGIAHDINNALSPVALYTEALLEREPGLSENGRAHLTTILRAIEDVSETVARIREFYRPRDSQGAHTNIDLNRLIEQVIGLTRARWSDQPQLRGIVIEIKTELAAGLPVIAGAEGEIRIALTNLIFNAIDAMPEGGTLTLRTRLLPAAAGSVESARVCVEVSDTGIGMSDITRQRCFEPFFTTKGERGTGLGLAMVYGMAQRHGGELEIETELGKGTTLRLTFPVVNATTGTTARAPPPQIPQRPLRILVVDDDPVVAQSLRDSLHGDGHLVTTADGGRAGIDAFMTAEKRGEPFTAVITDLGMPHCDGRKVAAAIRAASPNTPIILLTGWGQRLASEQSVPPEVNRLLSKPPKLRDLRSTLAELTQGV